MANKRIYDLTEDTAPASGDYIATDKSGEGAASKVDLNRLLLASGTVAGSSSQAQDFGATGIKADVVAESGAGNGVAVDGVELKDGQVAAAAGQNILSAIVCNAGEVIVNGGNVLWQV